MDSYEIVYAADDGFAPVLGVSIQSLLQNNLNAEKINITILDNKISKENKKRLEKICLGLNRQKPRFVNVTNLEDKLNLKLKLDRGSISQYARLMIDEAFSSEVRRVLYLDCDTLIVGKIDELWNLNLDVNEIVGVSKDAFSKYYRKNIDLNDTDMMFNSGVMLIDLEKWRKFGIRNKIINFIKDKHGNIQQGDQGVLNGVLCHYAKVISPKFNMVSIFYDLTYKQIMKYRRPVNFYSKDEIENAKNSPIIFHYTSSFYSLRPWQVNDFKTDAFRRKWEKVRRTTGWSINNFNRDIPIVKKLLNMIPKGLLVEIAAPIQIYLRPLNKRL